MAWSSNAPSRGAIPPLSDIIGRPQARSVASRPPVMRGARSALLCLAALLLASVAGAQTGVELVGKPVGSPPHFHWVQNVNGDAPVYMAIDGRLFPAIVNATADVYVVADRSAAEWQLNNVLTDVTVGGARTCTFAGDSIQQNTFQLAAPNELVAYDGTEIGVGYDVVIDMDGDGLLSPGDWIDGADGPGFYALHDLSQPGAHAVTTQDWIDTVPMTKRIWYPTDIGNMAPLPLIVISHGWTHDYTLYDYIGEHLASYGYIVVSHWNDVGNGDPDGTQTASLSLIANIDHLLAHQDSILGGVLDGKIDFHRMGWMGHSTGGESPVRAYTRLHRGENASAYFGWQDVQYIGSFCPVSWFADTVVNPYAVNYHQFIGGADTDVSGAAINTYTQPMTIYERGTGNKHVVYVHGAGHGVFNTDSLAPNQWATGPDLIDRAQLFPIVKAYGLAMSDLYCKQNPAGKEFFTRSHAEYHPMNTDPAVVISNEYRDAQTAFKRVIDDFETQDSLSVASSGARVTHSLPVAAEVVMKDISGSFTYSTPQLANGMTRARFSDAPHCIVLEWDSAAMLRYTFPDSIQDCSGYEFLSFRACQRTRHPLNVALGGDIGFVVTLVDEDGDSASLPIQDHGPIVQTYQRGGGWQNEFCTVRMRLSEFVVGAPALDLSAIAHLAFSFGGPGMSPMGALGIDDIELVGAGVNFPTGVAGPDFTGKGGLVLHPNPSGGTFTATFPHTVEMGTLEIHTLLGARVFASPIRQESAKALQLPHLAPGVYVVKLSDGAASYCKKLVIE